MANLISCDILDVVDSVCMFAMNKIKKTRSLMFYRKFCIPADLNKKGG